MKPWALTGPMALLAGLLVLAGCGSAPTVPAGVSVPVVASPRAVEDPPEPATQVLGSNERYVIVRPGPQDTAASLAARYLGGADKAWLVTEFNGAARVQPGVPLVLPVKPTNLVGLRDGRVQTVTVLCYHRFGTTAAKGDGGRMVVSPSNFAQQLDWLQHNGYTVIRLSQLVDFLEGRGVLPRRAVVITVDDGYESTYTQALPLLRQRGMPATVFVYTDFIGASDALSWAQLRGLVDSGLFEIGAHSKTHRNLTERQPHETDAIYRREIANELRASRAVLEKRLGITVQSFAMPYGDANAIVLDELKQQQYTLAATVTPGGNTAYADRLLLRRTMVFGEHDLAAFKSLLR